MLASAPTVRPSSLTNFLLAHLSWRRGQIATKSGRLVPSPDPCGTLVGQGGGGHGANQCGTAEQSRAGETGSSKGNGCGDGGEVWRG